MGNQATPETSLSLFMPEKAYDRALTLLKDLCDLADRQGRKPDANTRIR
jgi:hypothetical protein